MLDSSDLDNLAVERVLIGVERRGEQPVERRFVGLDVALDGREVTAEVWAAFGRADLPELGDGSVGFEELGVARAGERSEEEPSRHRITVVGEPIDERRERGLRRTKLSNFERNRQITLRQLFTVGCRAPLRSHAPRGGHCKCEQGHAKRDENPCGNRATRQGKKPRMVAHTRPERRTNRALRRQESDGRKPTGLN